MKKRVAVLLLSAVMVFTGMGDAVMPVMAAQNTTPAISVGERIGPEGIDIISDGDPGISAMAEASYEDAQADEADNGEAAEQAAYTESEEESNTGSANAEEPSIGSSEEDINEKDTATESEVTEETAEPYSGSETANDNDSDNANSNDADVETGAYVETEVEALCKDKASKYKLLAYLGGNSIAELMINGTH